jgi:hypothetical protein
MFGSLFSTKSSVRRRLASGDQLEVTTQIGVVRVDVRISPRARRLALRIHPSDDTPEIVVPTRAARAQVEDFLIANAGWLAERLKAQPPRVAFAPGAVIPFRGEPTTLEHARPTGSGVRREGDRILVAGDAGLFDRKIRRWLAAEALGTIAPIRDRMAESLGRPGGRIRITDPKSRWGSCSADGQMTFSWRLILTPPSVLTYVVAHECAHLIELNHSVRFWRVLENLCPNSIGDRDWLKRNGAKLLRYGM